MTISEIINKVKNGAHVRKLALRDASKLIANCKGEYTWNATLVEKSYVERTEGDEVIQLGSKQVNITKLQSILGRMVGNGEAIVWIGGEFLTGEIVAE